MWTSAFWKAVAERALWTFAQALLAVIGIGYTDLLSIPWQGALSTAGLAALLSLLKSIAVNSATSRGPSLTNAERVSTPPSGMEHGRHEYPDV